MSPSEYNISMSAISPPAIPPYRISFFYGPELVPDAVETVGCVFNVKKRSWKGGIQVEVRIQQAQIIEAKGRLGYVPWIEGILVRVPSYEQDDYAARAADLFVQALCAQKLDLAIEHGLEQIHTVVEADQLGGEFDGGMESRSERVKAYILHELDLE